MSRYFVILAALLAAAGCYALGMHWQAFALIVLGMGFEVVFWVSLFSDRGPRKRAGSEAGPNGPGRAD